MRRGAWAVGGLVEYGPRNPPSNCIPDLTLHRGEGRAPPRAIRGVLQRQSLPVVNHIQVAATVSPAPSLRITHARQNLILAWPVWAAAYRLQEAHGATSAQLNWTTLPNNTVTNGNENVVTLPLGDGTRFYRLWRP